MGQVAKSYIRKGFLIYEEMRKYLTIYEEAVSHLWICNRSLLNFLIYEEHSVRTKSGHKVSLLPRGRSCLLQSIFLYIFLGGLECVGHSFAYVAHLWFLSDVWIRTQSAAVASWSATDLATHTPVLATHPPNLAIYPPWLSHPSPLT